VDEGQYNKNFNQRPYYSTVPIFNFAGSFSSGNRKKRNLFAYVKEIFGHNYFGVL
jgi:hypothetical protein